MRRNMAGCSEGGKTDPCPTADRPDFRSGYDVAVPSRGARTRMSATTSTTSCLVDLTEEQEAIVAAVRDNRWAMSARGGSDGTLGAQQFSRPPPSASLSDPTAAESGEVARARFPRSRT